MNNYFTCYGITPSAGVYTFQNNIAIFKLTRNCIPNEHYILNHFQHADTLNALSDFFCIRIIFLSCCASPLFLSLECSVICRGTLLLILLMITTSLIYLLKLSLFVFVTLLFFPLVVLLHVSAF